MLIIYKDDGSAMCGAVVFIYYICVRWLSLFAYADKSCPGQIAVLTHVLGEGEGIYFNFTILG